MAAVYFQNRMKHVNILYTNSAYFLKVNLGKDSYHWLYNV